ncbi:hypothetical protein CEY16_10370 [Halalkalibacillus sediminis]|uniref:CbiN domain protein n=1 Tax=Halalkalibacillus sediminis TaxID=2018042 RepID=A0A2I0QSQ4_9BACI|nr:hypothetical protein [Halalkalibacillus sediminis]PKR77140.1 hypothetical protein CEY16_10370 [Halalkalibacillus sediminis]
MRFITGLLMILSMIFLLPVTSTALSSDSPSIEESFESYDGVVIGSIDAVYKKNSSNNYVRVKVEKSYKGVEKDWIIFEEDVSWGQRTEEGSTYILFLDEQIRTWENPLCSPSKVISDTSEENEFLKDQKTLALKEVEKPDKPINTSWFLLGGGVLFIGGLFGLVAYQVSKN